MSRKIEDQLTHEELEFAYNLINSTPMTSKEVYANASAAQHDYSRTLKSLNLLVVRMHVAIHGDVPEGTTDDPAWYKVSSVIKDYVFGYGINSHHNVAVAREKRGLPVKRMTQEDATKLFLGYCKQVFKPNTIKWHTLGMFREMIVTNIRNGADVAQAVKQIVTH